MLELSEVIQSPDFAQAARHPSFPQAFTRTRKLPLPGLIAALLCQRGQSQQVTLDSFFASLCDGAVPLRGISDRAFAKARDQLYMPALSGLNDLLVSISTPLARGRCTGRNFDALPTTRATAIDRRCLGLSYKVNGSSEMTDPALVRA